MGVWGPTWAVALPCLAMRAWSSAVAIAVFCLADGPAPGPTIPTLTLVFALKVKISLQHPINSSKKKLGACVQ